MRYLLVALMFSCGGPEVCSLTPEAGACCAVRTEIPRCLDQQLWTCTTSTTGDVWLETGTCR